jgi:transcription initiation factor IIF auxiliary subunit
MALKLKNNYRYLGKDQWEWDAFLDSNQPKELDEIEYVEYVLHPTFDNPIREIKDRESNFRLSTSGWGTFKLKAFAYKKDGTKIKLEHNLELYYPDEDPNIVTFKKELNKLSGYRGKPDWKDFFSTIDEIEKLSKEINDEMHNDPSDTTKLDARANALKKMLEDKQQTIANRTTNKEEYDAVFNCIYYLSEHYNLTK